MNHRVRGSVPRLSSMLKCPKAGQEGGCAAKTPEQLQTGTLWNVKNCSISKCKAGHDRRTLLGFWVVFSSNDNEEGWEETHLPWSLRGTAFLCTVCLCLCHILMNSLSCRLIDTPPNWDKSYQCRRLNLDYSMIGPKEEICFLLIVTIFFPTSLFWVFYSVHWSVSLKCMNLFTCTWLLPQVFFDHKHKTASFSLSSAHHVLETNINFSRY